MTISRRMMQISPSMTLAITSKANQLKKAGAEVISFGAGEPDFDTPEHIKKAADEAIASGFTKYTPTGGIPELKEAVCEKLRKENNLNYSPEEILISCGAKHSLFNAILSICQEGDEVILPSPYWVSYPEMIKLSGAKPVIVKTGPENNFKITPQQLKETITPQTKLFILNSPTNPTGMVYTKKELLALGEVLLSENIFCLSDEIYEKIIYDGLEYVSIASLFPEMKKICLVVNGVSKAYAMTGWRIGYAAGPAEIIKVMSSLQSHSTSGATSISQKAALSALTGPQEEVEKMRKEFEGRRDYIVSQLNSLPGISCFMPKGAFYVFPSISGLIGRKFQGETIKNSFHLAEMLLEKVHLAVVPGVAFGEDNYLRFSYATSLENIVEGISRLKKFIEGLEK